MTTAQPEKASRLIFIDITKAFAIILVVVGHWNPDNAPVWWAETVNVIYTFHMPLFLAMSGYLYMHTHKAQSYLHLVRKKILRLMLPYLIVSLIIILIKTLTQGVAYVENPVTPSTVFRIFYYPSAGYFLWFIWTLFELFLIMPALKSSNSRIIAFIIASVASYVPFNAPETFCLGQTQRMAVFFFAGVMLHDFKIISKLTSGAISLIAIIFVASEIAVVITGSSVAELPAFLSVLLFPAISSKIVQFLHGQWRRAILSLAAASYVIYLFHTTFEGLAKSVVFKLVAAPMATLPFIGASVAIIACGIAAPWWLYTDIFRKFKATRLMFGLKADKAE